MEVLGLVLLYLLADLLFRLLGLGAYAHGSRRSPKVALTFDDGPSERTEALLDLLHRHGVKATFFLTGERARKRPDLVARIRAEGHQVEDHGLWHSPWRLLLPWLEWRHMAWGRGRYYRPPHGLHTPFTRPFAWILGKRVALWDTEAQDWLDRPPEVLAERALFYLRPGSILLLHDGPPRTLPLLKHLLPRLLALGYEPVTLDELDPKPLSLRLGLIRALQGLEERFNLRQGLRRAGLGPFHLFRLGKRPFPGPPLPGIPQGSPAFELHLESQRLMELSTFEAVRYLRESLRKVAEEVAQDPEVRLVYGLSHLAPGGRYLGFKAAPLPLGPRLLGILAGVWFSWLYRGECPKDLPDPGLAYLTREELLERYPPGPKMPPWSSGS